MSMNKNEDYMALQSRTLVVRNCDNQVTREILFELFNQGGPVKKVVPQQGFFFVEFSDWESVAYSLALFSGVELFGKELEMEPKISYNPEYYKYVEQLRLYPIQHDLYEWHKNDEILQSSIDLSAARVKSHKSQSRTSSRNSSGSRGSGGSSNKPIQSSNKKHTSNERDLGNGRHRLTTYPGRTHHQSAVAGGGKRSYDAAANGYQDHYQHSRQQEYHNKRPRYDNSQRYSDVGPASSSSSSAADPNHYYRQHQTSHYQNQHHGHQAHRSHQTHQHHQQAQNYQFQSTYTPYGRGRHSDPTPQNYDYHLAQRHAQNTNNNNRRSGHGSGSSGQSFGNGRHTHDRFPSSNR